MAPALLGFPSVPGFEPGTAVARRGRDAKDTADGARCTAARSTPGPLCFTEKSLYSKTATPISEVYCSKECKN